MRTSEPSEFGIRLRSKITPTLILVLSSQILLAIFDSSLSSQPSSYHPLSVRLQAALDSVRQTRNLIGVSAAVVSPDQELWLGTSGMSDPAHDDSIRPEMRFSIGSITKTFTSALILQLAEEGKLNLNDPLSRWLPDIPHVNRAITIRQLLNHTSGIYNYTESSAYWNTVNFHLDAVWKPEDVLSYLSTPYFAPGANWHYSNTNYILLGMIIREVTKAKAATELRNRFFDPLNLTGTFLEIEEQVSGEIAHGFSDLNGDGRLDDMSTIPREALYSSAWTAGAIVSTAEDIARWAALLYGRSILSQTSLREMTRFVNFGTTPPTGYGLGIQQMNLLGEELWGHGGSIPGYVSLVIYSPEKKFSIAVLINQGAEPSPVTNALLEVLLEDLNTGVRELTQSPADDFRLTQNYPNPFNPTTEIRYLLSSMSEVELIIYNQAGQKIKTLVDSKLPAGEHRTRWDATNDAGVRVANGVYLYRLRVGAMVQTRKMVLVR